MRGALDDSAIETVAHGRIGTRDHSVIPRAFVAPLLTRRAARQCHADRTLSPRLYAGNLRVLDDVPSLGSHDLEQLLPLDRRDARAREAFVHQLKRGIEVAVADA